MNIIYDYQIFSAQVFGGISRYFVELCRQIGTEQAHAIEVLAPIYFNQYLKNLPGDLKYGRYMKPLPRSGKIVRACNRIISHRRIKTVNPDILHATYYYPVDRSARKNRKIILTVYDMINEKFPHFISGRDHIVRLKSKAIRQADHIICISDNTRC